MQKIEKDTHQRADNQSKSDLVVMFPFGDHVKLLAWISRVACFQLDGDQILSEIAGIRVNGQAFPCRALGIDASDQ